MNDRLARVARITTVIGMLAIIPLLAACAKSPAPASGGAEKPASASTEAKTPATIKVLEPAEGAEVPAGELAVKVETTGLKFTMPSNTNVAGEGHVHFTLDDRPFVMSVEPEVKIKDVTPGAHTLRAEIVQNDTKPLSPPVEQVIEFTAK